MAIIKINEENYEYAKKWSSERYDQYASRGFTADSESNREIIRLADTLKKIEFGQLPKGTQLPNLMQHQKLKGNSTETKTNSAAPSPKTVTARKNESTTTSTQQQMEPQRQQSTNYNFQIRNKKADQN